MGQELLNRRTFGNTSLEVPPIAMGCAPLGDMPDAFGYGVPEDEAIATVIATLASPFPYIDTAALYGDGVSEKRVGMALKEIGGLPEGAILQTKAGRNPVDNDYSGETVKRRFERSLELLGVDHLDVVFLHDAEWTTFADAMAPGGPVEVLRSYQEQGIFDYLGVASGPNEVELQYLETGLFDAVITHNRYTLLNTNADPLIDAAVAKGIAVLNAAPYGSGILSRGPDSYPRFAYQQAPDHLIARAEQLREICNRHGVPLAAAALQFSMLDPRITVTIAGLSRPERVANTVELASIDIPIDVWEEIEALGPADSDDPEINRFPELAQRRTQS